MHRFSRWFEKKKVDWFLFLKLNNSFYSSLISLFGKLLWIVIYFLKRKQQQKKKINRKFFFLMNKYENIVFETKTISILEAKNVNTAKLSKIVLFVSHLHIKITQFCYVNIFFHFRRFSSVQCVHLQT